MGNVNHILSNPDSKAKMRVTDVVIDEIVRHVLELEAPNKLRGGVERRELGGGGVE